MDVDEPEAEKSEAKKSEKPPAEKSPKKSNKFQCLDCESTFAEKSALKKHCSLKGHAFLKEEPKGSSIESTKPSHNNIKAKKVENEISDLEKKMKKLFTCDLGCGFKSKFLIALNKHKAKCPSKSPRHKESESEKRYETLCFDKYRAKIQSRQSRKVIEN